MAAPKAEKPTKPRKAPAKKKIAVEAAEPVSSQNHKPTLVPPTYEQIAALAHKYWAERGYTHGHAEHDWLRAEQELMKAS